MNDTVTLRFQTADDGIHEAVGKLGQSVMEAAVLADVPGIDAECGGCCNCATCHVFAPAGFDAPNEQEDEMLDETATPRTAVSRLSCQIDIAAAMDGMTFVVPAAQS